MRQSACGKPLESLERPLCRNHQVRRTVLVRQSLCVMASKTRVHLPRVRISILICRQQHISALDGLATVTGRLAEVALWSDKAWEGLAVGSQHDSLDLLRCRGLQNNRVKHSSQAMRSTVVTSCSDTSRTSTATTGMQEGQRPSHATGMTSRR